MLIRDLEAIYVLIMSSSDTFIPYNVVWLYTQDIFSLFCTYCLDYSPSKKNGGVNQRLEKLEQLINTGANIA